MHLVPVYGARFDNVIQLENHQAICQIWIEPVDVWWYTHRIHPVPISLFLARLLQWFQTLDIALRFVQSGVIIEHISNEGQVELVNAIHNIAGRHESATAEFRGLLKHNLRAWHVIRLHQGLQSDSGGIRRDLLDEIGVDLRVRDVGLEIVAPPGDTGVL